MARLEAIVADCGAPVATRSTPPIVGGGPVACGGSLGFGHSGTSNAMGLLELEAVLALEEGSADGVEVGGVTSVFEGIYARSISRVVPSLIK